MSKQVIGSATGGLARGAITNGNSHHIAGSQVKQSIAVNVVALLSLMIDHKFSLSPCSQTSPPS
jgi:hypothetical protein